MKINKKLLFISLGCSALFLGACSEQEIKDNNAEEQVVESSNSTENSNAIEKIDYYIYYSDEEAMYLEFTQVEYELTSQDDKYKKLFELLKTQKVENGSNAVPENVELLDYTLSEDGKKIILNFSESVLFIAGTTGEIMFVDSVNNSYFSTFKDLEFIEYYVEGEKATVLSHLDVSEGFNKKN